MKINEVIEALQTEPKTWLITGVAGFIGSNLLETLLKLNQKVVGLDDFSTGYKKNLTDVRNQLTSAEWSNFRFIEGDICDYDICTSATQNVDYVLHQAALGSVPRSIENPLRTNEVNIKGFLNVLDASRDSGVQSFTYAASSSTYGDHPALPKREENIGNPLSPYAVTKYVNELYASVYARVYGFKAIGLRYFNVFGKRQNPNGAYAAVIPKWVGDIISGEEIFINGDGSTSRDFCFIENVIQMNILAATSNDDARDEVYNVAVGDRNTLNQLFNEIRSSLEKHGYKNIKPPSYRDFRAGDVMHSQADINKAVEKLGYFPEHNLCSGLCLTMPWYVDNLSTS